MFDRNLMKIPGMPAIMGALVILGLLQAALIIAQALVLARALSGLWAHDALDVHLAEIAAFFACFALLQLVRFCQETMLDSFSAKASTRLGATLLGAVFDPRRLAVRSQGSTKVVQTATDGLEEVQTYIRIIPPKIVGLACITLPVLVAAFILDWVSGLILAVMFPVIIFFMVLLGKQARARAERRYESYTRLSKRFMDTLRGLETLASVGAERIESESVHAFSERLRVATVRTLVTATLSSVVLDLCATFGVAAVAMMLAFRLMDESLALQTALAALILAPEFFLPIRSFAGDFHASLDGKNALSSLLDMTAPRSEGNTDAAEVKGDEHAAPSWGPESTLSLRGITVVHGDETHALDGVSLDLRAGTHVAVIGKSGAGKSTLADVIAGFRTPDAGRVLIDGTEASLGDDGWKTHVRYLPQKPALFRMTLRDNIAFYNPKATDEQISEAVRVVGLEPLVASLPQGLETPIGQGLRELSGGQAHRVALARVLVDSQASVLVFDEPTAHLDIETEYELKQAMLPLMEGKLVIFATHRLHWVASMDRVVELEGGRIIRDEEVNR